MRVQVDSGHSEPDEAREQRLLHVGVFLEGHVLPDRRQLVVVADHDPPLQPVVAVHRVLGQKVIGLTWRNTRGGLRGSFDIPYTTI